MNPLAALHDKQASSLPVDENLPARQASQEVAVALNVNPGEHELQDEAPATEWVPDGQDSQSSAAPTLNVLASQSSVPVRPLLGFFPAPAVKQKAAPSPEYSPGESHAVQIANPPFPKLPAVHALHSVSAGVVHAFETCFPVEHISHELQDGCPVEFWNVLPLTQLVFFPPTQA
jgi:hypothetical protein